MKRIIFTIFLVVLNSIFILAQPGIESPPHNTEDNEYNDAIECYKNTDSLVEFKRCIKNRYLPVCPKGWNVDIDRDYDRGDYSCRFEEGFKEDLLIGKRRKAFEENSNVDSNVDKKIPFNFRLSNEEPESFEPR